MKKIFLLVLVFFSAAHAAPQVTASILPLASLAAAVAGDPPALLLSPEASPHAHQLLPSEAKAISGAQVVFWVGPSLESFMPNALSRLAPRAWAKPLIASRGIKILTREDGSLDPHIWLDPENASAMAAEMAQALSEVDPKNRPYYEKNLENLQASLQDLEEEMQKTLAPVRDIPFAVWHDAYRYFTRRFGLAKMTVLHPNPEVPPSPRSLARAKEAFLREQGRCVFKEPQFPKRPIASLFSGEKVRIANLDPLGVGLMPDKDAYGALLRRLAQDIRSCLSVP